MLLIGLAGCSGTLVGTRSTAAPLPMTSPSDPPVTLLPSGSQPAPNPPTSTPPAPTPPDPNPPAPNPPVPSSLPSEQASAASAFIDSAGVVTHLTYTNTAYYSQFPQVLSALQSLGVHHIRDGYFRSAGSKPIVQAHQQLAAAGIKCDYVVPLAQSPSPDDIESLASKVGDMESLEAPNECDVDGNCGGDAATGIANMLAFLPTIQTAAQSLNVPLLGPSFTLQSSFAAAGNLASTISFNNLHVYFGGRNPGNSGWGASDAEGNHYGSFGWWLDQAAVDAPGLASVITETGYLAYPATTAPYTVPESVEAAYIPRTLLLSFKGGFKKTYVYELLDEESSPGYGLLNSDLSPRPAYTALKNLLSILNDSASGSFTPATLQYSLTGGDATLNHLLLEKQDGSFWLVLWLEQSSWDAVNANATPVTPQTVTLNLTSAYQAANAYQFDTDGNAGSTSPAMNDNSTSLTVTDQVTVIQIAPR